MIRVDINDTAIITSTRGAYTFYEQDAWAHFYDRQGKIDAHPQKVTIQLQPKQEAWPVGEYIVHPQSLYRGRYGNIELGRLVLVPKAQGLKAAA